MTRFVQKNRYISTFFSNQTLLLILQNKISWHTSSRKLFFLTSSDKNEQNRDKKLHLNCKRPHCCHLNFDKNKHTTFSFVGWNETNFRL